MDDESRAEHAPTRHGPIFTACVLGKVLPARPGLMPKAKVRTIFRELNVGFKP